MSNAFKYTERGSIEIKICVEGENVAISIHDTGKGIKQWVILIVFLIVFIRLKDLLRLLHLQVLNWLGSYEEYCRETSRHGRTSLDSQLGKGSVFTVKLPLGDARYIHDEHVHFADREKESDLKETDEDSRVGICAVANEESFQSEEGESKNIRF